MISIILRNINHSTFSYYGHVMVSQHKNITKSRKVNIVHNHHHVIR